MSFFEQRRDNRQVPWRKKERAPWAGPPVAYYSGVVPAQKLIAHSDKAAVILVEFRCFTTGCLIECTALARRTSEPIWQQQDQGIRIFARPEPGELLPAELLRFGVQFPGGATGTTLQTLHCGDYEEPAAPILSTLGGRGTTARADVIEYTQPLWLWPQPPTEDFDLVVEWPAYGIEETWYRLDGATLVEAAHESKPVWRDG